jgi:hypothetical protein
MPKATKLSVKQARDQVEFDKERHLLNSWSYLDMRSFVTNRLQELSRCKIAKDRKRLAWGMTFTNNAPDIEIHFPSNDGNHQFHLLSDYSVTRGRIILKVLASYETSPALIERLQSTANVIFESKRAARSKKVLVTEATSPPVAPPASAVQATETTTPDMISMVLKVKAKADPAFPKDATDHEQDLFVSGYIAALRSVLCFIRFASKGAA